MPNPNEQIDYRPHFRTLIEKINELIVAVNHNAIATSRISIALSNLSLDAHTTIEMPEIDNNEIHSIIKELNEHYKNVHGLK